MSGPVKFTNACTPLGSINWQSMSLEIGLLHNNLIIFDTIKMFDTKIKAEEQKVSKHVIEVYMV